MIEKEFLYCYKMTHDTGFAPNPYHGVLTLATCKPTIRRCAEKGYWISGWTSNRVKGRNQKYSFDDDNQKLIYLAKVTDKMCIEDYWKKYPQKRPDRCVFGDNIYEPDNNEDDGFKQHKNEGGHDLKNKKHDLSGKYVLICEKFYYFSVDNSIRVQTKSGFVVPRCKKIPLDDEAAKTVISQICNNYEPGIIPNKL